MKKLLSIALAAVCVFTVGCAKEVKKSTIDYDKYKSSDKVSESVDYTYYNLIGTDLTVVGQTDTKTYYFNTNVKALAGTKKYSVINYVPQQIGDFVAFNYTLVDGDNAALESGHVAYANDDMPENVVLTISLKAGDKKYRFYASEGEWIELTKMSHISNVEIYEKGKATAQYNVKSADGNVQLYMETVEYGDGKTVSMFFDSKGNLVAEGYYKDGKAKISKTAKILECDEDRLKKYIEAATNKKEDTSAKSE